MPETGPIYGVDLIDTLDLPGRLKQQMPDRRDLDQVKKINERVVAGYEVALAHLARLTAERDEAVRERDELRVFHDSPTWPYVLAFAAKMERKLAANRHKGDRPGWLPGGCTFAFLADKLTEERAEFDEAIAEGQSPDKVWDEAADEANILMMRADHYAALAARPSIEVGGG